MLLPLSREESLGMIRSILRVKLGRAPRSEALSRLETVDGAAVDRLMAAARGQEDLIKALEEVLGESV